MRLIPRLANKMGFGSGIQRGFPRYLVTLYMARQPGTPPQLGPADNQTGASLTGVYQDCDLQGVLWCYVTRHGVIRPSVSARRSAMGATLRARLQKSRVGSGSCECGVLQATEYSMEYGQTTCRLFSEATRPVQRSGAISCRVWESLSLHRA